jgi:hypothetical protein
MNKYAHIKDGVVVNISKWDGVSEYQVDGQLVLANDDTYIGGSYTNNAFVPRYTQEELDQMEAEAQAQAEAKEALRQSLITKLAATLTPEETALLEELL